MDRCVVIYFSQPHLFSRDKYRGNHNLIDCLVGFSIIQVNAFGVNEPREILSVSMSSNDSNAHLRRQAATSAKDNVVQRAPRRGNQMECSYASYDSRHRRVYRGHGIRTMPRYTLPAVQFGWCNSLAFTWENEPHSILSKVSPQQSVTHNQNHYQKYGFRTFEFPDKVL